jgi:hypothetical protein
VIEEGAELSSFRVALGSEGVLFDGASTALADEVVGSAEAVQLPSHGNPEEAERAIDALQRAQPTKTRVRSSHGRVTLGLAAGAAPTPRVAVALIGDNGGELQVAASSDGNTVVVATQDLTTRVQPIADLLQVAVRTPT